MNLELQRAEALKLCAEANIAVLPYGNAWWLLGQSVNQVVGEVAGLSKSDLAQFKRRYFSRH